VPNRDMPHWGFQRIDCSLFPDSTLLFVGLRVDPPETGKSKESVKKGNRNEKGDEGLAFSERGPLTCASEFMLPKGMALTLVTSRAAGISRDHSTCATQQ